MARTRPMTAAVLALLAVAAGAGPVSAAGQTAGAATPGVLAVSSPDDATLGLPSGSRLVFSTYVGGPPAPAKAFTFTDTGTAPLTVRRLAVAGASPASFRLLGPTSFTLAPGAAATVAVTFTPTAPTGCPSAAAPAAIGTVTQLAQLTWVTTAAGPTSAGLGGIDVCGQGGNPEPVLDQLLPALGWSTVVDPPGSGRRFLGFARPLPGTDELQVPSFVRADPSRPVSLTPVAHYGNHSAPGVTSSIGRTGWYAAGSDPGDPVCLLACQQLFAFAPDPAVGYATSSETLLPATVAGGSTSFAPSGAFGLYEGGEGTNVAYTDDGDNAAHDEDGADISPAVYLRNLRVFRAVVTVGGVRTVVPDTWLVAVDFSRIPSTKNNDFQDFVFVLRNARPAVPLGPRTVSDDLTTASVDPATCAVTGFDGVLANTAGDPCAAGTLAATPAGVRLTAVAGSMLGPVNTQRDALSRSFDASSGPFTVDARIAAPAALDGTAQAPSLWFGPDADDVVQVGVVRLPAGRLRVVVTTEAGGVPGTVQQTTLPAGAGATSIDLLVHGNTSAYDPTTSDGVHVPVGALSFGFRVDGGAEQAIGSVVQPGGAGATLLQWFSTAALAGIVDSGVGGSATFSRFTITGS